MEQDKEVEMLQCHLCNVEIITARELHEHMKESHVGEQVWPCSKCDKKFVSNKVFGDHKRRVHPSKTQQCKGRDGKVGCGKTFKRSDKLRDHLEKNCGKPLKKWEDLSRWGKSQRSKKELTGRVEETEQSQNYIDPTAGPSPFFKCDQCNYTTNTVNGLGQHVRLRHMISQEDGTVDSDEENTDLNK